MVKQQRNRKSLQSFSVYQPHATVENYGGYFYTKEQNYPHKNYGFANFQRNVDEIHTNYHYAVNFEYFFKRCCTIYNMLPLSCFHFPLWCKVIALLIFYSTLENWWHRGCPVKSNLKQYFARPRSSAPLLYQYHLSYNSGLNLVPNFMTSLKDRRQLPYASVSELKFNSLPGPIFYSEYSSNIVVLLHLNKKLHQCNFTPCAGKKTAPKYGLLKKLIKLIGRVAKNRETWAEVLLIKFSTPFLRPKASHSHTVTNDPTLFLTTIT